MDAITYCSNTGALVDELLDKAPQLVSADEDTPCFLVDKTPIVRNDTETMALVRDPDGALRALADMLTTLTVLGTYDEVFADPAKCEIYDRVYDQTSVIYTDEEGVERTYTPPRMFGVFPK